MEFSLHCKIKCVYFWIFMLLQRSAWFAWNIFNAILRIVISQFYIYMQDIILSFCELSKSNDNDRPPTTSSACVFIHAEKVPPTAHIVTIFKLISIAAFLSDLSRTHRKIGARHRPNQIDCPATIQPKKSASVVHLTNKLHILCDKPRWPIAHKISNVPYFALELSTARVSELIWYNHSIVRACICECVFCEKTKVQNSHPKNHQEKQKFLTCPWNVVFIRTEREILCKYSFF